MPINHRAAAEALIAITADAAQTALANPLDLAVVTSAATARALLAVEARLGELVEQLRIANVIAAFGTDGEDGLIEPGDQLNASVYVRAHVGDIVDPDPNGGGE